MILLFSIFILFSSSSESIEIVIHNEEVLLTLCFIAFIFFAYSYLSDGFVKDSQQKVEDLKGKLFDVISRRCYILIDSFDNRFLFKSLNVKIVLVISSLVPYWSFQTHVFKKISQIQVLPIFLNALQMNHLKLEVFKKHRISLLLTSFVLKANYFTASHYLSKAVVVNHWTTKVNSTWQMIK